jgi:hypothetical protein
MRDMQRGRLALGASLLALAAALAGCSASEIMQNLPSPAVAPDLSQPNHRRIVDIKSIPIRHCSATWRFPGYGWSITSKDRPGSPA